MKALDYQKDNNVSVFFYFNPGRLLLYHIAHLDLKLSLLISMFEWQTTYEMESLHPPSAEISH